MAALKLMRKLLKRQGFSPDAIVTDKLPSYGAALGDLGMKARHVTGGRSNNRAENSHLPVRQRGAKDEAFQVSQIGSALPVHHTLPFTTPSAFSVISSVVKRFVNSGARR